MASSFVWKLFKIEDPNDPVAKCTICLKEIKRGSIGKGQKAYSTSPLHNHAKKFHPNEYKEAKDSKLKILEEKSKIFEAGPRNIPPSLKDKKMSQMTKQLSLEESFSSRKVWEITDPRSEEIHKKIALMMALDNQPFSMTEDDGFIGLMAHLQPRYLIPSRRFFSENIIPKLYDQLKSPILEELSEINYVSFSSDIWTCSSSHETFISLSGHWIKKDFQRRDAVLHASHFPGSHTGINIADKLRSMWESWDLKATQRNILVRDGASNISLGADLAEIDSVHCTIHILQLVINDAILSQRSVIDILAKSRRLATHFNHSALACTEFKKLQEVQGVPATPPLLLVQDVSTRWNSTYLMLERLGKLKRTIQLYLADHNDLPNISSNEWKLIEKLLTLLQPFFKLTENMSSEFCTLSTVIPNMCTLERFLSKIGDEDQGVQTIKQELLKSLRSRFFSTNGLNIKKERMYVMSTAIDPRFKLQFLSISEREQGKAWLIQEVLSNQKQQLDSQKKTEIGMDSDRRRNSSKSPSCSPPRAKKAREEDAFGVCFMEIACETETTDTGMPRKTSAVEQQTKSPGTVSLVETVEEVDRYMKLPLLGRYNCPLKYWKDEEKFPILKTLSSKLLSTPASSVFSERIFSEYGNVFEKKTFPSVAPTR